MLVLISFIVSGTLRECISGIMHTLHWRCGERRSGDRVRVAVGPHFFAVRSTGAAICVKPCTLTLNPPPPRHSQQSPVAPHDKLVTCPTVREHHLLKRI